MLEALIIWVNSPYQSSLAAGLATLGLIFKAEADLIRFFIHLPCIY